MCIAKPYPMQFAFRVTSFRSHQANLRLANTEYRIDSHDSSSRTLTTVSLHTNKQRALYLRPNPPTTQHVTSLQKIKLNHTDKFTQQLHANLNNNTPPHTALPPRTPTHPIITFATVQYRVIERNFIVIIATNSKSLQITPNFAQASGSLSPHSPRAKKNKIHSPNRELNTGPCHHRVRSYGVRMESTNAVLGVSVLPFSFLMLRWILTHALTVMCVLVNGEASVEYHKCY